MDIARVRTLGRWLILGGLLLGLTACMGATPGPAAVGPTPDPQLAQFTVLTTQTRLIAGEVTVQGTVHNGSSAAHDITLRADFFDPAGKTIGSAQGVAEDVKPSGTGAFEIHGQVDPAQYGTTTVSVISLREQK